MSTSPVPPILHRPLVDDAVTGHCPAFFNLIGNLDMTEELPKLTEKQQKFVLNYVTNGNNATEAYRVSYDCTDMKDESINVEACKMLKNPKITPWLKQAQSNVQQVFEDEIKYSVKDCFEELAELQGRCKQSSKTYNVEKSCIELKGRLAGLFVDKHQVTGGGLADVLDQLK